jgi:single-stranded-DNA-specific exonuclease
LNRERQQVEERILREAVAQVGSWTEAEQRRRAYVVAGETWHEGVIGIVASRLVERFNRPVVMIAGGEELWKGSGRSVPAFDLHGGLAACSDSLERFGGHRAAAGLTIRPENVEEFARSFAAHAEEHLVEEDLRPVTYVDAVLPPKTVPTLELCEELAKLAPFGMGNPEVTLLAESCELRDLATVGEGKHLRFRVRAGGAIAFGLGAQLERFQADSRFDVAFRLQANHWNGTVAPQLVVRRVFDAPDGYAGLRDWLVAEFRKEQRDPAAQEIFEELGLTPGVEPRSLLESEHFRALLEQPSLARAA